MSERDRQRTSEPTSRTAQVWGVVEGVDGEPMPWRGLSWTVGEAMQAVERARADRASDDGAPTPEPLGWVSDGDGWTATEPSDGEREWSLLPFTIDLSKR